MPAETQQTEFALFEALSLPLLLFDLQGRTIWASAPAQEILGQFDNFPDALNAYTADTRFDDWHKVLAQLPDSDRPARFLNINCHLPSDGPTSINLTLCRLPSPDQPCRTLALIEDTTVLADLERQLAHSERLAAMGKFSAQLAHELNNPLDGILRYVNLAMRLCQRLDDPRPAKFLLQARRGLLRMVRVVAELLEFSRASDATLVEDRIDHIIDEVLSSLLPRSSDSAVTIIRRFGPSLPFIRTGNLFQLFVNLVCNAIEAMPHGGTLTVTAKLIADNVRITFADTGIGLPPGQADRVFEPFFTTKPSGKGTGLGLAICREIVEKYHGTITAHDQPSGGTILTIIIPLSSCQTASHLHLPRPIPAPQDP